MKQFLILMLSWLWVSTLTADGSLDFASGSWYDPQRNGEGFVVQVMPGDSALVTWFTYPPEGESGDQAWLIGQGRVDGNRIVIEQMQRPVGAVFGPGFDPSDVERENWGSLELTFTDCDSGEATWSGPAEFGDGGMALSRLSYIDDVECTAVTTPQPDRVISGRSGAWFDPSHDGEGWMMELLPDGRAVVYWFTYDDQGRQAWLIGVGTVEGKTLWIDDMRLPRGTRFGAAFVADDIVLDSWGSFGFLFDDCANAHMRYASVDQRFGEGVLVPVQLLKLAATACDEPPPVPPLNAGTWRIAGQMGSAISESASASAGGYVYTGGGMGGFTSFERFDPVSGGVQSLPATPGPRHHPMMTGDGDHVYLIGGYQTKFGQENPGNNIWQFDPGSSEWQSLANMPQARGAGAALYWLDRIWVVGGQGIGSDLQAYRIDSGKWELYPGDSRLITDHMQAVAFENELWWLGGREGDTVSTVMIWNPVTRDWREGPAMNHPRAGLAAKVVQGQIIVVGGEVIDVAPGLVQPSMEIFAPGADAWVTGPAPSVPVHGTTGAEVNGLMVLPGGSEMAGGMGSNRAVQVYTPAAGEP